MKAAKQHKILEKLMLFLQHPKAFLMLEWKVFGAGFHISQMR